jgi:hypothetical protein
MHRALAPVRRKNDQVIFDTSPDVGALNEPVLMLLCSPANLCFSENNEFAIGTVPPIPQNHYLDSELNIIWRTPYLNLRMLVVCHICPAFSAGVDMSRHAASEIKNLL